MAKDIKFNIRLNIDGKNVVVQASESVKELQRNLMAAKTSSQRLNTTLIRFNQTAQIYTNVSGALSTLGGIMNGYISTRPSRRHTSATGRSRSQGRSGGSARSSGTSASPARSCCPA